MRMMKNSRKAMLAALAAPALVLVTATSTPAAAAVPQVSTIGPCHLWSDNETAGGWCDGTGPNWQYAAVATCANGVDPIGVQHWAGDRRGSYGYCSSAHSTLVHGDMIVTYNNLDMCDFVISKNAGSYTTHSC